MRGFLSLIFVASLASLAVSQQVYPERLSNSSDLAAASQKSNTPISSGYFGPLDALGTEPIPAKILTERSANRPTSKIAEFDSSEVRAAQFSTVPQTGNFRRPSTPVTSGYRETPTRPVRSSYFPSGQIYDETSPIRQNAANARENLCGCTDEWAEFCPCKSFPGPNFLPNHHSGGCCLCAKLNSTLKANSCGDESGGCNSKNGCRFFKKSNATPTNGAACDCVSALPIPESRSHTVIPSENAVVDSKTIEWKSVEMERTATLPVERLPFEIAR